jgi:hypothetical protein
VTLRAGEPVNFPWLSQNLVGFVRSPFSQCNTDSTGRKNPAAVILALRHGGDAKAVQFSEPPKQLDISLAPMADSCDRLHRHI